MKHSLTLLLFALGAVSLQAQETYESAQLSTNDLNGTARYIGMGGAMEALGADISTVGTNPAGMALFRRAWIGISGGATIQDEVDTHAANGASTKTNADLNQAGFVFTNKVGANSWFNLAFNYTKGRNFNQQITAAGPLDGYSSQSKMAYMKLADNGNDFGRIPQYDRLAYNAVNQYLIDKTDPDNLIEHYRGASDYFTEIQREGYINNFDFNVSANINDRVYLGLTFGVKDVHYESVTDYGETFVDGGGTFASYEDRYITGTGFDVKIGAIFRPIEDSPFRFGLYVHTPTWYDLTCDTRMACGAKLPDATPNDEQTAANNTYDYKFYSPWRFGLSLGHTVANQLALGFTYEYSDYSNIKSRIIEGYHYDYYWDYNSAITSIDGPMERNTKDCLRGVHLLKVGGEWKPVPDVAIRLGYNYESPIYEELGSKDYLLDSDLDEGSVGGYYATNDYINWGATQRMTFGLGFTLSPHCAIDIAYQYAAQKGDYHPFQNIADPDPEFSTYAAPYSITNHRHQMSATFSYRF